MHCHLVQYSGGQPIVVITRYRECSTESRGTNVLIRLFFCNASCYKVRRDSLYAVNSSMLTALQLLRKHYKHRWTRAYYVSILAMQSSSGVVLYEKTFGLAADSSRGCLKESLLNVCTQVTTSRAPCCVGRHIRAD